MSGIAGVSLSCWLSALALGVFSQLKPMSFDALQAVFVPVFVLGLSGALMVGIGAPLAARLDLLASFSARGRQQNWPSGHDLGRVHTRAIHM